MRFPSVFISHGAPTLVVEDNSAHRFLRRFGAELGRPAATCGPDDPMTTVAERFYREDLTWMAVVSGASLLGVLGNSDVLRARTRAERAASGAS